MTGERVSGGIVYFAYSLSSQSSQGDIFRIDPTTRCEVRITDVDVAVPEVSRRDPRWSPNRSKLVLVRDDGTTTRLAVVDPDNGLDVPGFVAVTVTGSLGGPGAAWVDERYVLRSNDGTIVYTDMRTGSEVEIVSDSLTRSTDRPTGNASAEGWYFEAPAWNRYGGIAVVAAHGSRLPVEGDGSHTGVDDTRLVRFTPRQVASVLAGGAALTLDDASVVLTPVEHGYRIGQPDWSPRGDRLVYTLTTVGPTSGSPGHSDVWMTTLATGDGTNLTHATAESGYGPVFGPGGDRIAFIRGDEDKWTNVYVLDLGPQGTGLGQVDDDPAAPPRLTALTDDTDWFRGGMDW